MYQVQKIVSKRTNPQTKQIEYQIKWVSFPPDKNTWVPESGLRFVKHMIREFEESRMARESTELFLDREVLRKLGEGNGGDRGEGRGKDREKGGGKNEEKGGEKGQVKSQGTSGNTKNGHKDSTKIMTDLDKISEQQDPDMNEKIKMNIFQQDQQQQQKDEKKSKSQMQQQNQSSKPIKNPQISQKQPPKTPTALPSPLIPTAKKQRAQKFVILPIGPSSIGTSKRNVQLSKQPDPGSNPKPAALQQKQKQKPKQRQRLKQMPPPLPPDFYTNKQRYRTLEQIYNLNSKKVSKQGIIRKDRERAKNRSDRERQRQRERQNSYQTMQIQDTSNITSQQDYPYNPPTPAPALTKHPQLHPLLKTQSKVIPPPPPPRIAPALTPTPTLAYTSSSHLKDKYVYEYDLDGGSQEVDVGRGIGTDTYGYQQQEYMQDNHNITPYLTDPTDLTNLPSQFPLQHPQLQTLLQQLQVYQILNMQKLQWGYIYYASTNEGLRWLSRDEVYPRWAALLVLFYENFLTFQ